MSKKLFFVNTALNQKIFSGEIYDGVLGGPSTSYNQGRFKYDLSANQIVITTYYTGETDGRRRVQTGRTVLTGSFAYNNGRLDQEIERYTSFVRTETNEHLNRWVTEDGESYEVPTKKFLYFYANDNHEHSEARKQPNVPYLRKLSQLHGTKDIDFFPLDWWEKPFSPIDLPSSGETVNTSSQDVFIVDTFYNGLEPDPITNFNPKTQKIRIDSDPFNISGDYEVDFKIAKSSKQLKKLQKSDFNLIYNRKDGSLYYNVNREEVGFGNRGGLIAVLDPKLPLTGANFEIF